MVAMATFSALVAAGGSRPTSLGSAPLVSSGPVSVHLSGCDAVAVDAVCEVLPKQKLRVLVEPADVPVVVWSEPSSECGRAPLVDLRAQSLHSRDVGDADRSLCVEDSAHRTTRRSLVPSRRPVWLREALAARKSGDLARAEALAAEHAADRGVDGARALALSGRLAMSRGDTEVAARKLASAVDAHSGQGRWSEEADDRFALAFTLATHAQRYSEARAALAGTVLDVTPENVGRRAYYRAVVAHQSGDSRLALLDLEEAKPILARVGLEQELADAEELAGLVLIGVGRSAEGRERLLALDARTRASTAPCTRATRLVNLGLASMRAWREAGNPSGAIFGPAEARALATSAQRLGDEACPGGLRHANAALLAAEASMMLADVEAASAALEDAKRSSPGASRWFELRALEVSARLASAKGEHARALLDVARAVELTTSPQEQWQARTTQGELAARAGNVSAAIEAYEAAERALDALAALVPFGEGRAAAVAGRAASAASLVALLAERGLAARALSVARHARTRALVTFSLLARAQAEPSEEHERVERGIVEARRIEESIERDERSAWTLSGAEKSAFDARRVVRAAEARRAWDGLFSVGQAQPAAIAPLDPNELTLHFSGSPERPTVLVAVRGEVHVHRAVDPVSVSGLLGPHARHLSSVRRVRVLSSGALDSLRVHALPYEGGVLAARVPVVYGLDVPSRDRPSDGRSVVVADPSGDLPFARVESDRVAALAAERGTKLVRLAQAEATPSAVRSAISGANLFHYAGHALAGGHDGSSAGLILADGARLEVAELLALESAPRHVVLSACEAGKDEGKSVLSLGLAQAFVLAGSRSVLAPDVRVDDPIALEMGAAVHAALFDPREGELDLADALSSALRRTSSETFRTLTGGFAAFRVYTP
jgi:tetratricopeptide (TPR) repeat protein